MILSFVLKLHTLNLVLGYELILTSMDSDEEYIQSSESSSEDDEYVQSLPAKRAALKVLKGAVSNIRKKVASNGSKGVASKISEGAALKVTNGVVSKGGKGADTKGSKSSSKRCSKKRGDDDDRIDDFIVIEAESNQEDAKSYSTDTKSKLLAEIVDKFMEEYLVLQEGQTN